MAKNSVHDIFSDYLEELGVRHTKCYSRQRFRGMTFMSLFGLCHLLQDYKTETLVLQLGDTQRALTLPTPYLAQTRSGMFVIVTEITADGVDYKSEGVAEHIGSLEFANALNGVVLLASPNATSCEPEYKKHRITELAKRVRDIALMLSLVFLFVYGFVQNGLWRSWATIALSIISLAGIYISWLLMKKTLNIRSAAADAVCGAIQKGGCDHVLSSEASKLLGLISWSEVGMGYFCVTMLVLLTFPSMWGWLAICNVCCLPYAFWSIWYQKTRARHWCTLCLTVQALLWLSFPCYLLGGLFTSSNLNFAGILALGSTYVAVVALLNRVDRFIKRLQPDNE